MKHAQLNLSRLIVGIILVSCAVLLFVFGSAESATAGAIALGVIGLISIAIARRR